MNSASLEGRPSGPLDARTNSASLEVPRLSPPWGLGVGEISALFETTLGGRKLWLNHPAGRDAFTRQSLRGGRGGVADGVRRRQLALAIMPHSERGRCLISLHPLLCRYSRHGAGL